MSGNPTENVECEELITPTSSQITGETVGCFRAVVDILNI